MVSQPWVTCNWTGEENHLEILLLSKNVEKYMDSKRRLWQKMMMYRWSISKDAIRIQKSIRQKREAWIFIPGFAVSLRSLKIGRLMQGSHYWRLIALSHFYTVIRIFRLFPRRGALVCCLDFWLDLYSPDYWPNEDICERFL